MLNDVIAGAIYYGFIGFVGICVTGMAIGFVSGIVELTVHKINK